MRLIDADAMTKYIEEITADNEWLVSQYSAYWIDGFIESRHTVDAVEVKHGRWIKEHAGNGWDDWWNITCSVCGKELKPSAAKSERGRQSG